MSNVAADLRRWGVGLRSYSEPWLDTSGTSPVADLMLNIWASFPQFERVRAGMARARKQGKHVGRPAILNGNLDALWPAILRGRSPAAWRRGNSAFTPSVISRALRRAPEVQ